MSNAEITERLEEAIELMELLDVNSFKINAYRKLIQSIEADSRQIQSLSSEEISASFSKGMSLVLQSLVEQGTFAELSEMEKEIPFGVRTMLRINGIGPKKIRTLWKDAGIESLPKLKEACIASQVSQLKGFGEKIQQGILDGIAFLETVHGRLLMHKADKLADKLESDWEKSGISGGIRTGDFAMHSETFSGLDFLFPLEKRNQMKDWFGENPSFKLIEENSGPFHLRFWNETEEFNVCLHFAGKEDFEKTRFMLETEKGHWVKASQAGIPLYSEWKKTGNNADLYSNLGWPAVPAELRNGTFEWSPEFPEKVKNLINYKDLKGCLHNHSTWSDGKNSIRQMADWCINQGWDYFGIADHSQTARYANGLNEDRVFSQWAEIDALNTEFGQNFRILKGIESDILGDGSLDYTDDILSQFDYVVASVHSIMKMDIRTATSRIIKAVENPFTSILGHCSGRILLKRSGYPLDYEKVIDACTANHVAIELNAHPSRLDMDWQNLARAIDKGAIIAINPDAHEDAGMAYMQHGVWMARKAGAPKELVLNAFNRQGLIQFLQLKNKSIA